MTKKVVVSDSLKLVSGNYRCTTDDSTFYLRVDSSEFCTLLYQDAKAKPSQTTTTMEQVKRMIRLGSFEKVN